MMTTDCDLIVMPYLNHSHYLYEDEIANQMLLRNPVMMNFINSLDFSEMVR